MLAVSAAPEGAQSAFVCVYPGFHIGLCPHSTLGFAGVSCLKALIRELLHCEVRYSLVIVNFDALAPYVYELEHWSDRRGYIQVLLYRTWANPAEKCTVKVRVNNEFEIQICY